MRNEFGSLTTSDLDWVLGIEIAYNREAGTCAITQRQYIMDQCREFGLMDAPAVATPALANFTADPPTDETALSPAEQKKYMSIIGALNYVQKQTRLDVAAIISVLSQFLTRAEECGNTRNPQMGPVPRWGLVFLQKGRCGCTRVIYITAPFIRLTLMPVT